MSKTRVNYKSDLPPIAVTFKLGSLSIDVPTHDFVVRFFIEGAPGKSFVCSYLDGVYKNCEKTDASTLTCYIDNHGFQCGRLCCEYVSLDRGAETGGKYADGIYKVVTPSRLDIILVDGPSDTATTVVADASVDLSEIVSDIEGLQSDVRDILIALDGKLDYYDASWAATEGTPEDFAALMSAVLAGTPILYAGVLVNALRRTSSRITLTYDNGKYVNVVDIVKDGDDINISNDGTTLATAGDLSTVSSAVTSLGSRVTTAEGNITSLGNRLTTAEGNITSIQNDLTGSGTTVARYHSASWLDTEEGEYDGTHPERRAKVRYTSLLDAVEGGRKLIKKENIIACGADVTENGAIILSFLEVDENRQNKIMVYRVTQPSGTNYCEVEKSSVSLPVYKANWISSYGTRDQMDEIIDIIQSTPQCIIMVNNKPVIWSAVRTNDVVQLSVMSDESTIRVYTVEYSSGSGETRSTYSEFEIQEALVSGTNIKTINNQSLLGSGNISIQGGGGGSSVQSDWSQSDSSAADYIKNKPTIPDVSGLYTKPSGGIPSTDLASAVQTSLGKADTALQSAFCPIIEDTRSSAVADITGVAPFASLNDGQRILLHFAYYAANDSTLELTLSDGTTTTGAKTIKHQRRGATSLASISSSYGRYIAGQYIEMVYNGTAGYWVCCAPVETNTVYSAMTQTNINEGSSTTDMVVSPKLLCDNFSKITPITNAAATPPDNLAPNKMYNYGELALADYRTDPNDNTDTTASFVVPNLSSTGLISNAVNFYALYFVVGTGVTSLSITLPTGVDADDTPDIAEGDYVEILIINSKASVKVWTSGS